MLGKVRSSSMAHAERRSNGSRYSKSSRNEAPIYDRGSEVFATLNLDCFEDLSWDLTSEPFGGKVITVRILLSGGLEIEPLGRQYCL